MWPNSLFLRAFLSRSLRVWLIARVGISGLLLLMKIDPLRLTFAVGLDVIVLMVLVCIIDSVRLRERALIGNMGIATPVLVLIFAVPPICGECAVRLVSSVIR